MMPIRRATQPNSPPDPGQCRLRGQARPAAHNGRYRWRSVVGPTGRRPNAAEQRDHGDGNLPAERSKPASQPLGPRALNNSPTSAMHTSSDCTASAPRRLRNLAEPRRMRPVLRHKGWLNPHAPGIPLRTQQPLPPRAEQPHPPAPPEPHPKKHHRHLQSGEGGSGWPRRRLERPGDLEPPSQTAAVAEATPWSPTYAF
jgi:hypothetical protein